MAEGLIRVMVYFSPAPRQLKEISLELPSGSTVSQALYELQSKRPDFLAEMAVDSLSDVLCGVWNQRIKNASLYLLHDGDRLELYRPLLQDAMSARRERFRRQGARSAGLFAQRRPGAKPGY